MPRYPSGDVTGLKYPADFASQADLMVENCDTLVGWAGAGLAVALANDGAFKTEGAASVCATLNGAAGNKIYWQAPVAIDASQRFYLVFDFAWHNTGGGFRVFDKAAFQVSSAVALGSPEITQRLLNSWFDHAVEEDTFYEVRIPLALCPSVRCLGVTLLSATSQVKFWFDNVRLERMTEAEAALAQTPGEAGVLIAPDYTPGVAEPYPQDLPATKILYDSRHPVVGRFNRTRHLTEYQIPHDGSVDVTRQLADIIAGLPSHTRLVFPGDGLYRTDYGITLLDKQDVVLDLGSARFYKTVDNIADIFFVYRCKRIHGIGGSAFGYKKDVVAGAALTVVAGGAHPGTLDALNDEQRTTEYYYGRDKDHLHQFGFWLSDDNHVANDCQIKITDSAGNIYASTTIPALTAVSTLYTLSFDCGVGTKLQARIKKLTAGANTITIANVDTYRKMSFTDDDGSGWNIMGQAGPPIIYSEDLRIEGWNTEAMECEAVSINGGLRCTVKDSFAIASRRQGHSDVWSIDSVWLDCGCDMTPFSGIDFEPGGGGVPVTHPTLRHYIGRHVSDYVLSCDGILSTDVDFRDVYGSGYGLGLAEITAVRGSVVGFHGASGGQFLIDGLASKLHIDDIEIDTSGTTEGTIVIAGNGHTLGGNIRVKGQGTPGYGVRITGTDITLLSGGLSKEVAPGAPTFAIPLNVTTATRPEIGQFSFGHVAQLYPNTFKGLGVINPFFPGGLDMLQEALKNVRGISPHATQQRNNLSGTSAVGAGAGALTITFPVRAFRNPASFALTAYDDAAGTLAGAPTTYYYRVAGRTIVGGPIIPLAEKSIVVTAPQDAVQISLTDMGSSVTGYLIQALTVYRGVAAGDYDTRYDIIPTHVLPSFGGQTFYTIYDLGGFIEPRVSAYRGYGYAAQYAAAVGPGVAALVDETGYEDNTNYMVVCMTDWGTTVHVTARRTDGFDLAFGTIAPGGGGNLYWMLVGLP